MSVIIGDVYLAVAPSQSLATRAGDIDRARGNELHVVSPHVDKLNMYDSLL